MKLITLNSPRRAGFTLVELLVAMALTLFVMTILVEAFGSGMDTFQTMRSLGDIQDNLRSTMTLLKTDLAQDHFEGARHLSDVNFWDEPRREGFFVVTQGSRPVPGSRTYVDEGADLDGVNRSFLATDHRLNFSVRLRGNRRENFFFESTGGPLILKRNSATNNDRESIYGYDRLPTMSSQWGEVAYFLVKTPVAITETTGGTPAYGPIFLHNLYRAANLTIPYVDELNKAPNAAAGYYRISRTDPSTGQEKFLSPNDFPKGPAFRTKFYDPTKPILSSNENAALSLVCTNVVSMQIRIMKDPPSAGVIGYEDVPVNAAGVTEFDSAIRPASVPAGAPPYRLIGIQIILRVYDPATGLTRQATLSQDL